MLLSKKRFIDHTNNTILKPPKRQSLHTFLTLNFCYVYSKLINFTCFSSLLISRARLDDGDPGGVPPAKRGESERIGDRPRQLGLDPRESLAMFIGALFIASILLKKLKKIKNEMRILHFLQ